MSDIKTLESALAQAKKVYKADKKNAANKKTYKVAKKALEAAQLAAQEAAKQKTKKSKKDKKNKKKRKREVEAEVPTKASVEKKAKIDITALESALAQAKAAHKADKSDAGLKKAYKAAKKTLAAAKEAETKSVATEETKEETKSPEANPLDDLKSLKKTAEADAPIDHSANPANTSVYCGNLSFSIDEAGIREFFKDCGGINDIHWLTDKETQDFLGRGFVNFDDLAGAAKALELDQTDCLGRPIRINYAKARTQGGRTKGGGGNNGSRFVDKPLSERPDNCVTAFLGNVSFEIDDDAIYKLAKDCGEVKSIRWLTDRETGDFKGCGFVDFWNSEDLDKFVKLRGQDVMGRPIRIDYSAPRAPRD